MTPGQLDLFPTAPALPAGLRYAPDVITPENEASLADAMVALPFRPFQFQGFTGNRRVVSFGWRYAFDGSGLHRAEPIPDFLLPVRDAASRFAGLAPNALEHVLVTEYAPGAAIGWHRDRPVFGEVVGLSLLSPARLRFRRRCETKWERADLIAKPRSAYHLTGEARSEWEHSIPAVEELRYSITFRTLRA
ncbi:MAG TPA: alpha-ketoglutarate-dependent dioxygenase AlkB [Allosphingosinicella sp.]|jgi:alkylated DNA repair dioxygenase AlkB|uniref:alpha-ketoglutarate-dependent dioxygenase AlkB n=1 Tax=Allosphingosinicella sp. TaxID=2823234 RepID=UPI002F28FE76